MKKSTKGALAAGAAGVLLLGGAGSLAYWTDAGTVTGSDITSGHLALEPITDDCDDAWQLNDTEDYVTQVLVPGDTLTKHCSYTVSMSGTNLAADLDVAGPVWADGGAAALEADLDVAADFAYDADGDGTDETAAAVPGTGTVEDIADGAVVEADLTVSFRDIDVENNASNLSGKDLSATLDDTTVTITQTR
jgi:alternate signal-mediated exported protein